jgi:hypothetical protein
LKAKGKATIVEDVVDSWEEEADEVTAPVLPAQLKTPFFRNVSRLSLAHPSKGKWNISGEPGEA